MELPLPLPLSPVVNLDLPEPVQPAEKIKQEIVDSQIAKTIIVIQTIQE